mmetsp:Transcript_4902/g.10145  ORF Transcript_4902/g.10145 Transcript_4902/m.10145 type:complete len:200 (+) Transcript_4902:1167-1766(+)
MSCLMAWRPSSLRKMSRPSSIRVVLVKTRPASGISAGLRKNARNRSFTSRPPYSRPRRPSMRRFAPATDVVTLLRSLTQLRRIGGTAAELLLMSCRPLRVSRRDDQNNFFSTRAALARSFVDMFTRAATAYCAMASWSPISRANNDNTSLSSPCVESSSTTPASVPVRDRTVSAACLRTSGLGARKNPTSSSTWSILAV